MRSAIASRLPDTAMPLIAAAVLSVSLGAAVSTRPDYVVAVAVLAAATTLGRWNRGVLVGVLAVLVLNGVPFVNVDPNATGGNAYDDVTFVALLAVLAVCAAANWNEASRDRIVKAACAWSAVYLAWLGWQLTRSVGPDESLVSAVKFGRDFVFLGFLIPLGLAGIRRREHLAGLAMTLGAAAALYAIGQILSVAVGLGLPWLVHVGKTASFDGVVRIYAPMNDLLIATFPIAIGIALLGPRNARPWAAGLAVLTGIANALSFTRAVYASETVALLLVALLYGARAGWEGARIRRVALVGATAIALAVVLVGGAASGSSDAPLQAVVARTQLGFSDVADQGGNVGYRLRQAQYEAQAVGGHWLAGRGLLTPASFWVQGERNGSVRNSDLGAFSTLATLGVIGLILIFLPVVAGLSFTLRERGPIAFGGAMYLGAALIGSITLATLSSVSGILVMGSVLVLCFNWSAASRSAADCRPVGPV